MKKWDRGIAAIYSFKVPSLKRPHWPISDVSLGKVQAKVKKMVCIPGYQTNPFKNPSLAVIKVNFPVIISIPKSTSIGI